MLSIKVLLFAHLHEIKSMRELIETLITDELQSAVGLESISFSQSDRKLSSIPNEFLESLFMNLVNQIHEKISYHQKKENGIILKNIDSSTLFLS